MLGGYRDAAGGVINEHYLDCAVSAGRWTSPGAAAPARQLAEPLAIRIGGFGGGAPSRSQPGPAAARALVLGPGRSAGADRLAGAALESAGRGQPLDRCAGDDGRGRAAPLPAGRRRRGRRLPPGSRTLPPGAAPDRVGAAVSAVRAYWPRTRSTSRSARTRSASRVRFADAGSAVDQPALPVGSARWPRCTGDRQLRSAGCSSEPVRLKPGIALAHRPVTSSKPP